MQVDDAGQASCKPDVAQQGGVGEGVLNPLLRVAVITGVEAAVALHISRGDDLNSRDGAGHTPLMLCALKDRPRICSLLLAAGAKSELVSRRGQTAFDIAIENGAAEVAMLLRPSTQQVGGEVGGNGAVADLDAWESEDEQAPPDVNPELAIQASQAHHEISRHTPQDLLTEWLDTEVYLPQRVEAPTRLRDDDDVQSELRLILLRGIREGSVPDMSIEDIAALLDIEHEHGLDSHLRQVLADLGAETDERFEYVGPDDNFKVYVEREATEEEEGIVSDVFMRLDSIIARRNESIRQYLRSIQHHSLLSAAEELLLGQTMDTSLQQAIDLIATDDAAIQHILAALRQVQVGAQKLGAISRGVNDPRSTVVEPYAGEESLDVEAVPLEHPTDQESDQEDVDSFDANEEVQLHSIVQSLERHLSVETPRLSEVVLCDILHSLRLSAGFLSKLADADDAWKSTTSRMTFCSAMQRYRQARDQMVTSNLKLVLSIAKKYVYSGLPLEDLTQEGNLGLIKAVERYDWRKGFRFSTFAIWWIRQQIGRSVADTGRTVRLPVHVHEKVQSLSWMIRKYQAVHDDQPSLVAMSEAMDMRVDKVAALLTYMEEITRIDSVDIDSVADPEFISRFHCADPEDVAIANEAAIVVPKLFDLLPRKQQYVLRLRHGIGVRDEQTLEEIGQSMGVTRERVRQIEVKALKALQNPPKHTQRNGISDVHSDSASDWQADRKEKGKKTQVEASQQDPEAHAKDESEQKISPLKQALLLAEELGIAVEDQRAENDGRLWVRITSFPSVAAYRLVKKLRALGFREEVGKGYWI